MAQTNIHIGKKKYEQNGLTGFLFFSYSYSVCNKEFVLRILKKKNKNTTLK